MYEYRPIKYLTNELQMLILRMHQENINKYIQQIHAFFKKYKSYYQIQVLFLFLFEIFETKEVHITYIYFENIT